MKPVFLFIMLSLSMGKINASNQTTLPAFANSMSAGGELTTLTIIMMSKTTNHINGDTLSLTGRIVKEAMENKKGQKLEGMQDLYFSTSTASYFIKPNAQFLRKDLEALEMKEITIKCLKKFGNIDIDADDPSYAQTRVGEYITIIEIVKQ